MRLIDIVSAPWAITPEMFAEVQAIYARHVRGEKIDLSSIEARIGGPLHNARRDLKIENGVAVIALDGVLAKRMNFFMEISGGTSTQIVGNQVRAALEDPSVRAIVLHIDSPGGTVDGTQEFARLIAGSRERKPMIAVADGLMASAAYWIGSAAQQIFMTDDTAEVGSIGVVATHTDWSKWEAMRGIKTTEITAGKYKRIASDVEPLSAEGRAVLQGHVDQIYSIFVDDVAKQRGVEVETVLKVMADGRLFIGQQAIKARLVDGVSTVDEVIAMAAAGEFAAGKLVSLGGVPETVVQHQEVSSMNLTAEQVKKEHPEVAKALSAEGHEAGREEGLKAGKAEGIVEGANQERERIKGVLSKTRPGHETLVLELAFDGKTTSDQAASRVLEALSAVDKKRVRGLEDDASKARANPSGVDPAADNGKTGATKTPPHAIARKARAYQDEQAKLGITVSDAEAVDHVSKEG